MKNYQARIQKVLEFIDSNIDESLTTEQLCEIAHFSKYHFHRLFSALVGMPLNKYIQYIKLKRAAYQLELQKHKKITDIAFEAGFENHESFSRAFKKACGLTPSQFRKAPNWLAWQVQPYKKIGDKPMNIAIRKMPAIRTALIQHHGDILTVNETAGKLIAWCEQNKVPIEAGAAFGLAYNDPDTTPADEFHFDFCVQLNNNLKINDAEIKEHILPEGRYAVMQHLGSHNNIGDTVKKLYRDWLPQSGEELRDIPCVFQYHNFSHEVQESALITDVLLPLK